ncbi:MAG: hypothetical protein H8E35_14830 [Ardenticatenia bacterium]|nr:hypothetical protein [Ardenticatenia bacterium]
MKNATWLVWALLAFSTAVAVTLTNPNLVRSTGPSTEAGSSHDTVVCQPTSDMVVARGGSQTAPLQDGRVLIVGGSSGGTFLASAEIYDPVDDTFTLTRHPMQYARWRHVAAPLPNGRVLVAGGRDYDFTAELFDPDTGSFSQTANTVAPRYCATSVLLQNGDVFLIGSNYSKQAEVYDGGRFIGKGSLHQGTRNRYHVAASLLQNGKVLVTGGKEYGFCCFDSIEEYDPDTGEFTAVGHMTTPRARHTSTVLQDGRVLLAGGENQIVGGRLDSAEVYDPVTGTSTATGDMSLGMVDHQAILLRNGSVLLSEDSISQLFDPGTGTFTRVPGCGGGQAPMVTLLDGRVLLLRSSQGNLASLLDQHTYLPVVVQAGR